jgi:hypothetical protein
MKSFFFRVSLFALNAIHAFAEAGNGPTNDFHITPGPGLPSLESVGLSNERLHIMAREEMANPGTHLVSRAMSGAESRSLSKRWDPFCVPESEAEQSCALWCVLYLNSLGDTPCVAHESAFPLFCTCERAGSIGAAIQAWPYMTSKTTVSSACKDVALGASWICNNCPGRGHNDCGAGFACLGGAGPAAGNGEMLVKIRGHIGRDGTRPTTVVPK